MRMNGVTVTSLYMDLSSVGDCAALSSLHMEFAEQLAVATMGVSCDSKMAQRFFRRVNDDLSSPRMSSSARTLTSQRFRIPLAVKFKIAVKIVVFLSSA